MWFGWPATLSMSAGRLFQLAACGHRGRTTDPLYRARRTLHTGADLLTDKQKAWLAS
jgi:transposase